MNLTESFGDWQGRELWRISFRWVPKVQGVSRISQAKGQRAFLSRSGKVHMSVFSGVAVLYSSSFLFG